MHAQDVVIANRAIPQAALQQAQNGAFVRLGRRDELESTAWTEPKLVILSHEQFGCFFLTGPNSLVPVHAYGLLTFQFDVIWITFQPGAASIELNGEHAGCRRRRGRIAASKRDDEQEKDYFLANCYQSVLIPSVKHCFLNL
jgi:hypothetical protein